MHKQDIAGELAFRTGWTPHYCETILNHLFSPVDGIVTEALLSTPEEEDGRRVTITGFGTIKLVPRAQRIVTHPATGQKMIVPASTGVRLIPSVHVRARLRALPA